MEGAASTVTGQFRRGPGDEQSGTGPRLGDRVGPLRRYRLVARIGEGAMGVVYQAFDEELDRAVALKCVHPRRTDPESRTRLMAEARTLARLAHPNIVPVFDITTEENEVFVAMELVEGTDLGAWGQREHPSWRRVLEVLRQAGAGLAHAHQKGVVHRDFKPANVLVGEDDRPRVADFGLARPLADSTNPGRDERPSSDRGSGRPRTGPGSGTPRYMAPEVLAGDEADELSDQYSFCVAAWELLYGRRPRRGGKADEASGARVPRHVRIALSRGLARDPDDRFASMNALLRELGRDPLAIWRRAGWVAAGALGVAAVAVWARSGEDPCANAAAAAESLWNGETRGALEASFATTGTPNAADAAARVSDRFADYVDRWSTQREEACRATFVERTQSERALDLRMTCLDDRLDAAASLLDVLLDDVDVGVVHRAVEAATSLPDQTACETVEATPKDGELTQRQERRALRSKLRRVQALTETGRIRDAVQRARDLAGEVEAAGDGRLAGEVALALALAEEKAGDHRAAEAAASKAGRAAARAADDTTMAGAWALMLWLVSEFPDRVDEFDALLPVAEAAVVRAGDDPMLVGRVKQSRARMLGESGKLDEAVAVSIELAEEAEQQLGADHPELPIYLIEAGLDLHAAGRRDEARAYLQRGAELDAVVLGGDHPRIAAAWHNLSLVADTPEEAERLLRRALALRRSALPPESPEIADNLTNLGMVLHDTGSYEDAESTFVEALALHRVAHGDHPRTATTLQYLAELLNDLGERDRARAYAQECLAMRLRVLPEVHLDLARSYQVLGAIAFDERKNEVAKEHWETSLRIRKKALREDHPALAGPYYGLGQLKMHMGDADGAIESCTKALELEEGAYGPDHPRVAVHLVCLGQALRIAKRYDESAAQLERAVSLWTPQASDPIRAALARVELANTLSKSGKQRDRALEMARAAKALFADHPEAAAGALAKAEKIIAELGG